MGLSWQQGPLSPGRVGRFLIPDPLPERLLYAEPLRRRIGQTDDRRRQVLLRWEERGGPVISAPERTGFGAKLIKCACEYDLEGEARLDYPPEGLICEAAFPAA